MLFGEDRVLVSYDEVGPEPAPLYVSNVDRENRVVTFSPVPPIDFELAPPTHPQVEEGMSATRTFQGLFDETYGEALREALLEPNYFVRNLEAVENARRLNSMDAAIRAVEEERARQAELQSRYARDNDRHLLEEIHHGIRLRYPGDRVLFPLHRSPQQVFSTPGLTDPGVAQDRYITGTYDMERRVLELHGVRIEASPYMSNNSAEVWFVRDDSHPNPVPYSDSIFQGPLHAGSTPWHEQIRELAESFQAQGGRLRDIVGITSFRTFSMLLNEVLPEPRGGGTVTGRARASGTQAQNLPDELFSGPRSQDIWNSSVPPNNHYMGLREALESGPTFRAPPPPTLVEQLQPAGLGVFKWADGTEEREKFLSKEVHPRMFRTRPGDKLPTVFTFKELSEENYGVTEPTPRTYVFVQS